MTPELHLLAKRIPHTQVTSGLLGRQGKPLPFSPPLPGCTVSPQCTNSTGEDYAPGAGPGQGERRRDRESKGASTGQEATEALPTCAASQAALSELGDGSGGGGLLQSHCPG